MAITSTAIIIEIARFAMNETNETNEKGAHGDLAEKSSTYIDVWST
jgi:hypothetical protein